ncbi:MAG TPA: hypothetical protein VMG39_13430 [Pseudolabrys sp.]|nr:hypothetical protein [Pseudolabrys sp.]
MRFIRDLALAIVLLAAFAGAAQALSYKNISGRWCGLTTNYEFASHLLIVTFLDGSPTKRFEVTSYEYDGDVITMHWVNNGEKLFTQFNEFATDGRSMAQVKSEVGPRRPFHRC